MADIFISYSRMDITFVKKLHTALSSGKNKDAWTDFEDIPPAARWRSEIAAAIEQADNFVFIISPSSIASEECGLELAHAIKQHKRLIGLVHREVEANMVHEALSAFNFIFCREGDDFNRAVDALITAVETDLEWVTEHTRLLTRAVEWERLERNKSLLLRGDDLETAEAWMARSGIHKPAPNGLQGQFILASRQDEIARQRLKQKRAIVAMDAFYRLTYDVREKLKDIPGTGAIRRYFIEGNIQGLKELVDIEFDVYTVRELATNYRALAEIFWKEGDGVEAAQAYRNSNEFTRILVQKNPSEGLYWRDLAASHANLGLLAIKSDPSEALEEYSKGLEAAEQAARLDPRWNSLATDLKSRVANLSRNKGGASPQ